MRRIYGDFAYSDQPRANCWWDETMAPLARPALQGAVECDVAIIGGGFTGLSAALHLAEAGASVVVLESRYVGWGASGRNGGFCCLGGGMLDNAALDRAVGVEGRAEWRLAEVSAVNLVEQITSRFGIDVDRHSDGETQLAHRPRDLSDLERQVRRIEEDYHVSPELIEAADLERRGMSAGFHGALTTPIGFALNPRKYVMGLADAAEVAGTRIFHDSPAQDVARNGRSYVVTAGSGTIRAEKVLIATNGYSSENLPHWLAGRYMPTQSSIIVTRPMSQTELDLQGWTSRQASYDTRHLLHYFRLMPDNRMLFGVRGGLLSNARSEENALARARRDFEAMFPAWQNVETPHGWSGMVCIARNRMPFVGEVPGHPGLFAGLCYHGNGVAMGSYAGALLADALQGGASARVYPRIMQRPLARFALGPYRRAVMPLAYAGFAWADR
jgi:glycine/D-amino acid oxidase-like deaminating enzyme